MRLITCIYQVCLYFQIANLFDSRYGQDWKKIEAAMGGKKKVLQVNNVENIQNTI